MPNWRKRDDVTTEPRELEPRDEIALALAWLGILLIVLLCGLFPTIAAFVYVEGVGLLIGGAGLYLSVRAGAFESRSATFWLLLGTFFFFILAQAFFQFLAPGL